MTTTERALRAAAVCAAPAALGVGVLMGAPAAESRAAAQAPSVTDGSAPTVSIARRRLNVVSGRRALVSGRVGTGAARAVALQRRGGHGWRTIDHARVAGDGSFAFRFRPREPGSAVVGIRAGTARRRVGRLNVYRRAHVSWYGPGLYGARLGCGGTLTPGTLGVAHKSLPCGAKVTLRHGGNTVRVRVVDRGPYAGGREFDLTSATRAKLGFGGVGTILVAD